MTERRKNFLAWLGERAAAALAVFTAVSLIFGFIWMVAENEVVEMIGKLSGVGALAENIDVHVEQTSVAIAGISSIVERHDRLLEELYNPKIIDYDELRSKVFDPCYPNEPCEIGIFAARTEIGQECSIPSVLKRRLVDRTGIPRDAEAAPNDTRSRIESGYEWRYPRFIPPARTPPGLADIQLILRFECPWGVVIEPTPRFPFEVVSNGHSTP